MRPVATMPFDHDLTPVAPVRRRAGQVHWELRSGAVAELFGTLLSKPDSVVESTNPVISRTAMVTVSRVAASEAAGSWLLRRYRYLKPSARKRDMLRRAMAVRGFRMALLLERAGLPTPRVLAAGILREFWVPRVSYLLVEEIKDAATLAQLVQQPQGLSRGTSRSVGEAIFRLHDAGFVHGDLTINNVLLDDAGKPWFIDLERTRKVRGQANWRQAVDDFHRFARHFRRFSPAGKRGALRLLRHYCRARGWGGREREFIETLEKRLRHKIGAD